MEWQKLYNPVMAAILRSPLHAMMSKSIMLVTFTGRKSGRVYTTPVSYVRNGDVVTFTTTRLRNWYKNLRDNAPVTLRVQGIDLTGTAQVIEDDDAVEEALAVYLRQVPQVARFFQVRLDADGTPHAEDIARAAKERVVVHVHLS